MEWVINCLILCLLLAVILILLLVLKINYRMNDMMYHCREREKKVSSTNDNGKQNNHPISRKEMQELVQQIVYQTIDQTHKIHNCDLKELKSDIVEEMKSVVVDLLNDYRNETVLSQTTETTSQVSTIKFLYASAADEKNGTFYRITDKADANSVFELQLKENGTMADFYVYSGANKMVLTTPDFLLGSCEYQRIGMSSVITNEYGEAALVDGKWKVIKKAIVTL